MSAALLDPAATAERLPPLGLVAALEAVLRDPSVQVPHRLVQPLPGGGSLFVMPACDARVAITKLITFTPSNAGTGRPTIQGDVVVFDATTGERVLVLDGPTVTARRTAAVSLLAALRLAPRHEGPLLIVGAGAQGWAHLDAFHAGLPQVREVRIASRSRASAQSLAAHARALGWAAQVVDDVDAHAAQCPLIVTCTPAQAIVLRARPRDDSFLAAVGAFTPRMVELAPDVCRHCAERGAVVLDTAQAVDEAGDLIQAGLEVARFPSLADVVAGRVPRGAGPVLFKSCGWAGWDLAAARAALQS